MFYRKGGGAQITHYSIQCFYWPVISFQSVFVQQTINMSEEEFDSALEDAKDVMLEDIDWFQGWLM